MSRTHKESRARQAACALAERVKQSSASSLPPAGAVDLPAAAAGASWCRLLPESCRCRSLLRGCSLRMHTTRFAV